MYIFKAKSRTRDMANVYNNHVTIMKENINKINNNII